MMNIRIIALGKLKEAAWRDACEEYLKRLRPYAKIDLLELPEEPFRDGADREKIKAREAERISKHIPADAIVIALHERGDAMDSVRFSETLHRLSAHGETIVFLIGGPLGFHSSILDFARLQLSLSPLTFPHQLCRVILLEQLYRAGTILAGKTYHY
jgi:23S rRNA (pseudouridine1915-N3)-methyltransferase